MQSIPVVDLNKELKSSVSPPTNVYSQKVVAFSGGFKIPQSVMEEKKRMFAPPEKNQSKLQPQQPSSMSQNEIFEALGLKPYTMEQSLRDKQSIQVQLYGEDLPLRDQPLAQSKFIESTLRVVEQERNQLKNQMHSKIPEAPIEDEDVADVSDQQLSQVRNQIKMHYDRIQRLEAEFMDHPQEQQDQQVSTIWEQVRQLKEYRRRLKDEQNQAKEEYEQEQRKNRMVIVKPQRKKDPAIEAQIEEFKKQKMERPKIIKKKQEIIVEKSPQRQIYEHQFEEFKYDKLLKQNIENRYRQYEHPEFDKYRNTNSHEKYQQTLVKPDMMLISDRAVVNIPLKQYQQLIQKSDLQNQASQIKVPESIDNGMDPYMKQYLEPIHDIFNYMQKDGTVSRVDLVKTIRNKLQIKILNLPTSQQTGSPSVNQILEKVLADYRICAVEKKASMMLISLGQLEQYFENLQMAPSEIQMLQNRIILAHFGPGSIAQEGYYQKVKNKCILPHQTIQQLLQAFMQIDVNCDLIIEKAKLIDRINQVTDVEQGAVQVLGKTFKLKDVLSALKDTINLQFQSHDSHFISLQKFTEYLTDFEPPLPKLPPLQFKDEPEQQGALKILIAKASLEAIQDVYNMIPRIYQHFVLKEEFLSHMKRDPLTKSLIDDFVAHALRKLQSTDVDFISWTDVVYLFSEKEDILQKDNKLQIQETVTLNPRRSPPKHQLQERQTQIVLVPHKQLNRNITIPVAPNFASASSKDGIRQRKVMQMVEEIQQQEEFELNNKFKAKPLPTDLHIPMYQILENKSIERKLQLHGQQQQKMNPPSFYEKDIQKLQEKKAKNELLQQHVVPQFRAKDVPMECNLEVLKRKDIEDRQRRDEAKMKRKEELITQTQMPKRLEDAEKKRKEKQEQIKNLKPSDIDPECKFNPKIKKDVPKHAQQQEKFEKKLEEVKNLKKAQPVQAKPFNLSNKPAKKSEEPTYLDEDNQRNKVPNEKKRKQQNKQIDLKNEGKVEELPEDAFQEEEVEEQDNQENQENNEQVDNKGEQQEEQQQQEEEQQQQVKEEQQEEDQEEKEKDEQEVDEQEQDQQVEEDQGDQDQQNQKDMKNVEDAQDFEDNYEEEENVEKQTNVKKQDKKENQKLEIKQISQEEKSKQLLKTKQDPPKKEKAEKVAEPAKNEKKPQEIIQKPQQAQAKDKATSKPLSSQDREIQRLQEEKEKKKQEKEKFQKKLDPGYQEKMKDMQDKVNKRDLMVNKRQHGSSNLEKYRQLAKQQQQGGEQGQEGAEEQIE